MSPEETNHIAASSTPESAADAPDELELTQPGARARGLAALLLLAGTVAVAVHTLGYSEKARAFPLLTLIAMGGLLVLQELLLLRKMRSRARAEHRGPSTLGRELRVVGWIALLAVSVLLLGLMVGTLSFLALYLSMARAARPRFVALIVVLAAVGLFELFVTLLHVRLPGGLLL